MGRLQIAVVLAVLWIAVAAHSAGVVLAPAPDQDSSGEPTDPPVIEPPAPDLMACIQTAIASNQNPFDVCEL